VRAFVARLAAGPLVAALLGLAGPAPVAAAIPCPHGRPAGPHVACTGPVTHPAGGGGGVVTIIVASLVGVGVAVAALAFVRRRLALDAARPPAPTRPRRPS
jgi:hypothetical protein